MSKFVIGSDPGISEPVRGSHLHISTFWYSSKGLNQWQLSTSQKIRRCINHFVFLFLFLAKGCYHSHFKDVETFVWDIKQLAQHPTITNSRIYLLVPNQDSAS